LSQDRTAPTLIGGNSTTVDDGMDPQYSPKAHDSNRHSFMASSNGPPFNSAAFIYESAPDLENIREFANKRYTGKLSQLGRQAPEQPSRISKQKRIIINGGGGASGHLLSIKSMQQMNLLRPISALK